MFREILKQNNLSQVKFANKLDVSQAAVSLWVTKKCTPKIQTMQKMAEILNVDLQTIVNCFVKDKEKTKKG